MKATIMNKRTELFDVEFFDEETISKVFPVKNKELLPVFLQEPILDINPTKVRKWLAARAIPASREWLREVYEKTGTSTPVELSIKANAMSLSDQYWIRFHEEATWDELNFFTNPFSDDIGRILTGEYVEKVEEEENKESEEDTNNQKEKQINIESPSCSTDGVVPKRWKIIYGDRCLIKGSRSRFPDGEVFRETFAFLLAKEVLPLEYITIYIQEQIGRNIYSICKNFITENTEFVPISHMMKKYPETKGRTYYEYCKSFFGDKYFVLDWILLLDYIVMNEDRHYGNFGLIRSAETGEILRPAPMFDTGSSLFYRESEISKRHIHCKPFSNEFHENIKGIKMKDYLEGLRKLENCVEEYFYVAFEDSEEYKLYRPRLKSILELVKTNIQTLINKAR